MNEDIQKEEYHRDRQRCNNANSAVQGCVYSDLNNKCIDVLMQDMSEESPAKKLSKQQIINILKVAKTSNKNARELLVKSQTSISNRVCSDYATDQFNSIHSMTKNNESIHEVNSISEFIVKDSMVNLTKELVGASSDRSGM